MILLRLAFALLFLAASPIQASSDDAKKTATIKALRKAILTAQVRPDDNSDDNSDKAAIGYRDLFTYLGRSGVKELTNDEDTSIALQAAWETLRKTVKRDPPIDGRADWVFEKRSVEQFIAFFCKRVKADPPDWWTGTLVKGDVFPGMHHAFIDVGEGVPANPKVQAKKDEVVITVGKRAFRISKPIYEKAILVPAFAPVAALWGDDQSLFARPVFRGYPFKVVAVDSKTGKQLWIASVWAARRGFSSGPIEQNPVEIRRNDDTVIVYGCESHGMYAEGFDAKTGKCRFRFCTCYWFNFSETWGLK